MEFKPIIQPLTEFRKRLGALQPAINTNCNTCIILYLVANLLRVAHL